MRCRAEIGVVKLHKAVQQVPALAVPLVAEICSRQLSSELYRVEKSTMLNLAFGNTDITVNHLFAFRYVYYSTLFFICGEIFWTVRDWHRAI